MTTTLQTVADLRAELAALGYWLDSLAAAVGTFNTDRPRAFLGEVAKQLAARAGAIRLMLGETEPGALTLVEEMYREPGGES